MDAAKRSLILKVISPLFIIVVIFGIYLYKNAGRDEVLENPKVEDSVSDTAENLPFEITSIDLNKMKSYGLPFMIDFGSEDCPPCRKMAPELKSVHDGLKGKAIVQYVDVWAHTDAAKDFPLSVIPTQAFFNADGSPFVPSDELAKEIEFLKYSNQNSNEHALTMHQGGLTEEQMLRIFAEMGVK